MRESQREPDHISLGLIIGRNLKFGLGWAYVEFVFYRAFLFSYPGLGLCFTLGLSFWDASYHF